jgi:hypothetical protein
MTLQAIRGVVVLLLAFAHALTMQQLGVGLHAAVLDVLLQLRPDPLAAAAQYCTDSNRNFETKFSTL